MVTFSFYQLTHMGTLSEVDFMRGLPSATKEFRNATHNRTIETIEDDFKFFICETIDFNFSVAQNGLISSTSDGVTSVSLKTDIEIANNKKSIEKKWLSGYYHLTFSGV